MVPTSFCGASPQLATFQRDAREPVIRAESQAEALKSGKAPDYEDAAVLLSTFCETYPATRFEPTCRELKTCWEDCARFSRGAVVAAILAQLADAGCSHVWQPYWRALRLLAHLYTEGEAGRTVAQAVTGRAKELLRFFTAEVPECQDIAARLLLLHQLSEVLPPGQECRMADEGGILFFTSSEHSRSNAEDTERKVAHPPDVESKVNEPGSAEVAYVDLLDLSGNAAATTPRQVASGVQQAPHAAAAPSSPSSASSLKNLSVAALRQELAVRGLSAEGCLEKSELVERIIASTAAGVNSPEQNLLDMTMPCNDLADPAQSTALDLKTYTHDIERLKLLITSGANIACVTKEATCAHHRPEVYNISDLASPQSENPELCKVFSFNLNSSMDGRVCRNEKEGLTSTSSNAKVARNLRPSIPLATDTYMREHIPRQRDPFDFVAEFVASA